MCVQPVAGLQASSVHTLPSSQLVGEPGEHDKPVQESPAVQRFPSSQAVPLGAEVVVLRRIATSFAS